MLKSKTDEYGFTYTIVRPYVTYSKIRIPLQFAPGEYYTIINRALHGKIIPVLDKETHCTLTWSKDFAVGLVGLIGSEKARNETFHITGDFRMTWNEALCEEMKAFGTEYETFGLSISDFRDKNLMSGLNVVEVYGDKGRDMLFDNSKIKSAVPEFMGKTQLVEALPEVVSYFRKPEHQKINYALDARCDRMLSRLPGLSREQKRKLTYVPGVNATLKDKIRYYVHRYDFTYFMYRAARKLFRIIRGR